MSRSEKLVKEAEKGSEKSGRRRAERRIDQVERPESSAIFWGLLLVVAFANFMPNGSVAGTHALIFGVLGALLIAFPPRYQIPRWMVLLAGAMVVTSFLPMLPRGLAASQPWRLTLEGLGLETGNHVAAHPTQTLLYLCGFAGLVLFGVSMVGHRISSGGLYRIGLAFVSLVAGYASLSMLSQDFGWQLLWDTSPSFGLFPNRNHTASLMATGGVFGFGVLYHATSTKRWAGAALAGLSLGILIWALLGYSSSRAGALLLGLGFLVWVVAIGRRNLSIEAIVSLCVLGCLAVVLFLASGTEVKKRIQATVTAADEDVQQVSGDDAAFDFRVLIYQDTARMLVEEPWTGAGIGMFRYVFPQYREASATNSLCVHPESDYLLVAAENGPVALVLLVAIVGACFFVAFRRNWRGRSWPLRLACLLAACVVPFHGIFDVPGHRIGLALGAVLLLSMTFRPSRKQGIGVIGVSIFRLGGIAMLGAGAALGLAELRNDGATPLNDSLVAAQQVRQLHAEDSEENSAEVGEVAEVGAVAEVEPDGGEDKIETAIAVAGRALKTTPLDPELHHLRGAMALYFDDKEALTLRSFAIQRLLDPTWTKVPLRQASAWTSIDPQQAVPLWRDALTRADHLASKQKPFGSVPRNVWSRIVQQAKGSDALLQLALPLASGDLDRLKAWVGQGSNELRAKLMPQILSDEGLPESSQEELLLQWSRAGDRADAEQYRATRPELGEIK
ncbi:MAG: O-antigen ligase [Pseudoalteromonas tetraodonis]|jgi:O-antigen ligase